MTLEFSEYIDVLELDDAPLSDLLEEGWVPDPVLMPTGRPNVVEGVGAIYHFVKGTEEEITEYVRKSSPELAAKRAEAKEVVAVAGEFDSVRLTHSLPHGVQPTTTRNDTVFRVYKVYEKVVIWLEEEKNKEASA